MLGASVPVMAHGCSPACTGARGAGRSRTRLASLATVSFNRRHFRFFRFKRLETFFTFALVLVPYFKAVRAPMTRRVGRHGAENK